MLITAFYALSVVVLLMRMLQYSFILVLYSEMIAHLDELKNARIPIIDLLGQNFDDLVTTARRIGSFQQAADYSKFALGFI